MKKYFEYKDPATNSNKFWEIAIKDKKIVIVRFGRIGNKAQEKVFNEENGILEGTLNESCECIPNETQIDETKPIKLLIKTIDILGRETTNKGFQLHIYDDGTVEKKYLIK